MGYCINGIKHAMTDSLTRHVVILAGDGIGPEVTEQASRVLTLMCQYAGVPLKLDNQLIGGCAVDATGQPLPDATLNAARQAHAILLGAVGGPQYDTLPVAKRPEQGLLGIRKGLGLFANLRPVTLYPSLLAASPVKADRLQNVDMMIVRELTGGAYFGTPREKSDLEARDSIVYTREEIERIAHVAFKLAQARRQQVCSVDKANVLATSQLWRAVVNELSGQYPDVSLSHMYVDNAAMQLIGNPGQFDVLLTENMFGDILSDEASMLAASLGMLPSASLGVDQHAFGQMGLYEPCHGSAPDIAGQQKANPLGAILSVALMCRYSLGLPQAAQAIEQAAGTVLQNGGRTADIAMGGLTFTTAELGDRVCEQLAKNVVNS
jgi:3-isopropylmalate dehydrogenase